MNEQNNNEGDVTGRRELFVRECTGEDFDNIAAQLKSGRARLVHRLPLQSPLSSVDENAKSDQC